MIQTDTADPLPEVMTNDLIHQATFLGFTSEAVVYMLILVVLIFLSALMSGSEVAFFSLTKTEQSEMENDRQGRSNQVIKLLSEPGKLLATILIANNVVNLGLILLSTLIVDSLFNFGDNELVKFIVNVVSVTFVLVLFGEVIPKVYANHLNVRFARTMAPLISLIQPIFKPFSFLLVRSTKALEEKVANSNTGDNITKEEIDKAIELATKVDATQEEKNLLKGIVKFGGITVKQIMQSRVDIEAIEIGTDLPDVHMKVVESGFSRLPVFKEDLDNITGIFLAKDLLNYSDLSHHHDWDKRIKQSIFVAENTKIDELLSIFQEKRSHMAIVVDEFGGTCGLVTLEDILEEIFGEINDEFDQIAEISYEKVNDYTFIFDGKTSINDFCRILSEDIELFDKFRGDADTLAGLLLEHSGRIPKKNEQFFIGDFEFKVLKVTSTRIERIRCEKKQD